MSDTDRSSGDHDELEAGSIRSVADVLDDEAGLGERVAEFVERCLGRVDADHVDIRESESAGEHTRTAPDVEDPPAIEFLDDLDVVVEVATIVVDLVVDLREPRIREDRIGCSGHERTVRAAGDLTGGIGEQNDEIGADIDIDIDIDLLTPAADVTRR